MFTFPALTLGFLFVAVPLLVHLINMLRHRRQRWAAMDFLLASYRKQRKWIVLRQLLLLLSRLALATILIALLAGWTGGRQWLTTLGGISTHHVVVLDDSYSMGDTSGGSPAYQVALQMLSDLTRRLSIEDGEHQLTVLRASRAALAARGGSDRGDAAADLSAQTIGGGARIINRVMATSASPLHTDLVSALEMAASLIGTSTADEQSLYVLSDFRRRDWEQPGRLAESLRKLDVEAQVQLVDCAAVATGNLALTSLTPRPDVWVAGVPVVLEAKVKNLSPARVDNLALTVRLTLYGDEATTPDPSSRQSGRVEAIPAVVIESLDPGQEVTKSFQVFIAKPGIHAVEVTLPDDALAADNRRVCTLPLTDAQRVLVIDDDADGRGAYHIESALRPGSQVRVGAVPDRQPASFLRNATAEDLAAYRAVYLVDLPTISESGAAALDQYVRRGGGLAWFLGEKVDKTSYNQTLLSGQRQLLPATLDQVRRLEVSERRSTPDVMMGEAEELMQPLAAIGDRVFALVGLTQSWTFLPTDESASDASEATRRATRKSQRTAIKRSDGLPLVTMHRHGDGRVVTVTTGLDGSWTNWTGDPTFVVFLLQTNAMLWRAASPDTSRLVDENITRTLPDDRYTAKVTWIPPVRDPPRLPIEISVDAPPTEDGPTRNQGPRTLRLSPTERLLGGDVNLDDLIRTGVGELVLTRLDGRTVIEPVATNLMAGESDLTRADHADVLRDLEPVEARFIGVGQWNEQANRAGTGTLATVLLILLAVLFALEQFLAYWASYHATNRSTATPSAGRSSLAGGRG